ncbi:zinc finger and BTB domain-containing protein 16-like [Notechis scutatus]|uniref:Zinc finger and BTB domain-containing protein 16-like n=1 Tax=Notechis scutatus TaxID=8663 RepID=A0A6J1VAC9_9SAUR|nr:zinc finger and BTB domain-containing protein 16-like [Notechis scutatus]
MKTYGCELCGKRFLDSLRLRMHLLAHSAGAKVFLCDHCGAQFSKEDALESHRQTHTGSDMAVFCLLCGKRFQTQTALQQHMEVHAGVRSYICSECNRTFPSHTALKRHLRSHTGKQGGPPGKRPWTTTGRELAGPQRVRVNYLMTGKERQYASVAIFPSGLDYQRLVVKCWKAPIIL